LLLQGLLPQHLLLPLLLPHQLLLVLMGVVVGVLLLLLYCNSARLGDSSTPLHGDLSIHRPAQHTACCGPAYSVSHLQQQRRQRLQADPKHAVCCADEP
jgi:hypothetical protein